MSGEQSGGYNLSFTRIENNDDFPSWASRDAVAMFFHETMKPYHDELRDVQRAMDHAFTHHEGDSEKGFLMLVSDSEKLLGACLMMRTGMGGYIPENILLFVTVDPETRGKGVGRKLIEKCISEAKGDVKLHVEYDNPAKRLYERVGFTTNYAEMRYEK